MNFALGVILAFAVGLFFYDSLLVSFGLFGLLPLFFKYRQREYGKKRREELETQFKDAMKAVSANLKAGYSVENSFREAWRDMALLYGEKSIVCRELFWVRKGLDNNRSLEELIIDLGDRSMVEDIVRFGEVFAIAKHKGGNLTGLIEMTASVIEQKNDVEQEVLVMISSRKLESNIMTAIPFFIIMYLGISSDDYFGGLYHNVAGITIMTACLLIYIVAYLISKRLVDIRI